jgi:diacylglycerol kinase
MKRPLIKSFACALRGICVSAATERNYRIHLIAAVIAIALGIYLGLSAVEWCLLVFAIGFVLVAEALNTALERMLDEITHGEKTAGIRNAKDISAAAVLAAAITALIVGIIILIVPLVQRLAG